MVAKRSRSMKLQPLAGLALLALTACSPVIPQPTPSQPGAPAASGQWEAAVISGSQAVSDEIIKIDVGSGAAWIHCCGSRNTNYFVIKDTSPPPPGDYHLITWSQVSPKGDVNWNVYRFDRKTGHTWSIEAPQPSTYYWSDVNTTVAFQ
jgi:hypothetical protein